MNVVPETLNREWLRGGRAFDEGPDRVGSTVRALALRYRLVLVSIGIRLHAHHGQGHINHDSYIKDRPSQS